MSTPPNASPERSAGSSTGGSPAPSAASASPQNLAEVIDRTRYVLAKSGAVGADAPGAQGLRLVRAWPTRAAYARETPDQLLCRATVSDSGVAAPFGNGWGRLFAADRREVTSATCGGAPLEVRRVGTVARGSRRLYAVGSRTASGAAPACRCCTTASRPRPGSGSATPGDRTCGEGA